MAIMRLQLFVKCNSFDIISLKIYHFERNGQRDHAFQFSDFSVPLKKINCFNQKAFNHITAYLVAQFRPIEFNSHANI